MYISFAKDAWDLSELTYAYSTRWEMFAEFTQEADCVRNRVCREHGLEHENVPLLSKRMYGAGTRISTRCSFENYGAPLIMLTGQLEEDASGHPRFSEYLEVVLYQYGVNVWHLQKQDGQWVYTLLLGLETSFAKNQIHTLSVEVQDKALRIEADDRKMTLHIPDLYPAFYAGITACEGINRFYDLQIEECCP